MHFSNYFRFMETVEHSFFRSLGYSVALSKNGLNVCLPRVHAECDFYGPLRFEDEVLIRLLVEKKGTRSLRYRIRFFLNGDAGEREVARGKLVVVCAVRQEDGTLKSIPLPQQLAAKIREAPRGLLGNDADHERSSRTRGAAAGVRKPARTSRRLPAALVADPGVL